MGMLSLGSWDGPREPGQTKLGDVLGGMGSQREGDFLAAETLLKF